MEGFVEFEWETFYVEANAWHLLWYVPYDTEGLIELFGGREEFVKKLEFFFEEAKKDSDPEMGAMDNGDALRRHSGRTRGK